MDKDVIYTIERIDNRNMARKSFSFFFALFFWTIILGFAASITYILTRNIILLSLFILFYVCEFIYVVYVHRCYKLNRLTATTALTCYSNGDIWIETREGKFKIWDKDIIKMSYVKFFVPLTYTMYASEGSPHYSRYYTPFFKLVDEGILKIKTEKKTYKLYIVSNMKAKIEHINKFVIKK